jgi:hypothetical protein
MFSYDKRRAKIRNNPPIPTPARNQNSLASAIPSQKTQNIPHDPINPNKTKENRKKEIPFKTPFNPPRTLDEASTNPARTRQNPPPLLP